LAPPYTTATWIDANAIYIGKPSTNGNEWDFDGNQVRVTFGGSNSVTTQSSQVTSDWINFPVNSTDDIIIAMDFGYAYNLPADSSGLPYGGKFWYASGGSASQTTPTMTQSSGYQYFITNILVKPDKYL